MSRATKAGPKAGALSGSGTGAHRQAPPGHDGNRARGTRRPSCRFRSFATGANAGSLSTVRIGERRPEQSAQGRLRPAAELVGSAAHRIKCPVKCTTSQLYVRISGAPCAAAACPLAGPMARPRWRVQEQTRPTPDPCPRRGPQWQVPVGVHSNQCAHWRQLPGLLTAAQPA